MSEYGYLYKNTRKINKGLREVQMDLLTGKIPVKSFDMGTTLQQHCNLDKECGTVGCIGGWLGMKLGLKEDEASEFVSGMSSSQRLHGLFYPSNHNADWSKYKPGHAALAIERYLNKDSDPWKNIKVKGEK